MDIEVKARWLEELRSGRYTQCKGYLNNVTENKHCCLGVLCETMGISKREIRGADKDVVSSYNFEVQKQSPFPECYLPVEFCASVGLTLSDQAHLASMNDVTNNYEAVISYIERHL